MMVNILCDETDKNGKLYVFKQGTVNVKIASALPPFCTIRTFVFNKIIFILWKCNNVYKYKVVQKHWRMNCLFALHSKRQVY